MTPREIIAKEPRDIMDDVLSRRMGFDCQDDVTAILESLRSSGYRIEPDWQPIETAPNDGTPILLFTRWAGDEICPEPFDEIQIGCWDEGNLTGDVWHREPGWLVDKIGTATHWRPLPAPPAIRAALEEKQG